jgi:hypothetical protein
MLTADRYLVSTLGLEPEHFHLEHLNEEALSHDWHVQPSCQRPKTRIRLSGAYSVQKIFWSTGKDAHSSTNPLSSKPFKVTGPAACMSIG